MDKQYVENAKTAGRIAAEALQYGASLIKPGASYHDVYAKIVDFIVDRGGFPAFPPQMSFDATAAHFMTSPTKDHVFSSEIVKLDVGVAVNGVIGDNALTIDLSGKYGDLVLASREAIELVRKRVRVGLTLGEIGALIEDAIGERGFVPVRNLSGHGLGSYVIHTSPTVPNYDNGDSSPIVSGMHFACEPFATDGIGLIGEVGTAEIYSYSAGGPVRDKDAKKIAAFVKDKYSTLPFSSMDLVCLQLPAFKLKVALSQLVRAGVLTPYPPLVEKKKGMVSQAEHTFLVLDDGQVVCTTLL